MLIPLLLNLASAVPTPGLTPKVQGDDEPHQQPQAALDARDRRANALATLRSPMPKGLTESELARARIRRAVTAALLLGTDSEIARRLKETVREAMSHIATQPRAASLLVELVAREVERDLAFEPMMEAALPEGFPYPAPAGEIRVVTYPGYRRAKTPVEQRRSNGAFFALFRHISSNDIAMTAPVEMTVDGERRIDMAFLYGDPETGSVGTDGRVEVQDVPPMTVVTMGVAGSTESQASRDALAAVDAWLERNDARWKRAGQTRVMGYNGPSVPRRRQFSEVQVPVAPVNETGERAP